VARPARRRPTLPAHDPVALRKALRRDIYADGDSLLDLDDVTFQVDVSCLLQRPDEMPRITADVNGYGKTGLDFPVAAQFYPSSTIRDVEGQRKVRLHKCPCDGFTHGRTIEIAVIGKYVRWQNVQRPFQDGLVFDRATYRERLEAALAEAREGEAPDVRAVHAVIERAPWGGPEAMGLSLVVADVTIDGLVLTFHDDFWKTVVRFRVPWDPSDLETSVKAAVREIAQWDHSRWIVSWFPMRHADDVSPPYPVEWHRDYYP